jgi:GT2 family glycosyltransferase
MAGGEYVFLLNSDTVLENNAIGLMHDFMQEHPRAAVCGPLLLNADKTVQRSIDIHPMFFHRLVSNRARISWLVRDKYHPDVFPYSQSHRISDGWLTGAVLMIRRAVFPEVGFLDEAYHFYNEDADWGLAVSRSGWETWFVPEAVVTHLLGGSPKARSPEQEISFKLQCLRQNRYYFWKNSGGGRYGLFRVLAFCVYAVNLLRRVIMAAVSPPNKRASAIFKMRLGWKMFLATIEPEGKKAN